MQLPHLLFAILLAMCTVIGITFVLGEVPFEESVSEETGETTVTYLGHGFAHPDHPSMLMGGDGYARHQHILWFGWAYAVLLVAFFVTLLAYGAQKNGSVGPLKIPLIAGGTVFAAIFTALCFTYKTYATEGGGEFFLSFPVPTAWMMYGVWLFPLCFMFLYMFTFDSWIFREEDMKRFQEILAEKQESAGDQK